MKKVCALALLCLSMAAPALAQSTFPTNASSAGIGTTTPTSVGGYGNLTFSGTNGGYFDFFSGTVKRAAITGDGTGLNLYSYNDQPIRLLTNNQEQVTLNKDGYLGIGMITPRTRLEVGPPPNGSLAPAAIIRLTGGQAWGHVLTLSTDNPGSDDPRLMFAYRGGAKRWALGGMFNTTRFSLWEDSGDGVYGQGWGTERFTILSGGNVGIGTSQPDQALTVNGTVHATKVLVEASVPTPDYVFEKDYKLRSLKAVEAYIKAHKHLPEVAPAAEMKEKGVDVNEMNMKLLQKVEELTLYIIRSEKQQSKMREEINALKKRSIKTHVHK